MHIDITGRELSIKILVFGPPGVGKSNFIREAAVYAEQAATPMHVVTKPNADIRFLERLVLILKLNDTLRFRVQLVTAAGDPSLAAVHQMAVSGTDGVLFLASAQKRRWMANKKSFVHLYDLIRSDKTTHNDIPLVLMFTDEGDGDVRAIEELKALEAENELPVYVKTSQTPNTMFDALWHLIEDTVTYLEDRHRVSSRFQMPQYTWSSTIRRLQMQSVAITSGEER